MHLNNLRIPGESAAVDLRIGNGKILTLQNRAGQTATGNPPAPGQSDSAQIGFDGTQISPNGTQASPNGAQASSDAAQIDFDGALVFPGLINSHDHLDFNLFPLLGNKIYRNYTEWGRDIHTHNTAVMRAVLQVPQELRTLWGIYKNLLNGFTTVVNHGERLVTDSSLIDVFQECHCLHSVGFEQNWIWKLNQPFTGRRPVVLHVGEGTDTEAGQEIDRLIRWNLFRRPLIGIHGVAMNERQAAHFHALVWCPASNYFLLDRTAPIDRLKGKVPVLFGTDSTLTAGWNSWSQIRMGRSLKLASDKELLDMLTTAPAIAWGVPDRGVLTAGASADLVIAKPKPGLHGMDAFYGLDPEDLLLVIHRGNIKVFAPTLLEPLTAMGFPISDFRPTGQGGKYVQGDLPGLMQEIRGYYPEMRFPAMP